uniref:Uncharacterized protein n=1 Tax=Kalanchoe fedtschenkoi TaxID=63787 RepID=A0A7N0T203_KALFE
MLDDRQAAAGPPHGIILSAVVAISVVVAFTVGGQGEALAETISELVSPVGLLLLPIALLLLIHFLSSDQGSFAAALFSTGEPNSIHRVSGSPVGVALFLILVVVLLLNRVSIFGGGDDGGD